MDNRLGFKNFDEEYFEELNEYEFSKREKYRRYRPYYLWRGGLKWVTLRYFSGDAKPEDLNEDFRLAIDGCYAHLVSAIHAGKPCIVPIDGQETEVSYDNEGFNTVFELMSAYILGSVCRNQKLIDFVLAQEDTTVFFKGGWFYSTGIPLMLDMLRDEQGVTEQQFNIYQVNSRNNIYSKGMKAWRECVYTPGLKLKHAYFLEDAKSFNRTLKTALDKDRMFRDSEIENRCRDVTQWMPWHIIMWACKAHDKGWEIEVEDPRLPMMFVTGKCNIN